MPDELVFTVQPGVAQRAQPISLAEAGLRERADLQEWIRENPEILGEGVRIVTFEFGAWRARDENAADRLDLLGLDDDGRLVVAELKRGPAPDTVEMQAIKYAAFASRFTPQTLAESHAAYLSAADGAPVSVDAAREQLAEHAGGELDPDLLRWPRTALVAASFPARVTAIIRLLVQRKGQERQPVWSGKLRLHPHSTKSRSTCQNRDRAIVATPVRPFAGFSTRWCLRSRRTGPRARC